MKYIFIILSFGLCYFAILPLWAQGNEVKIIRPQEKKSPLAMATYKNNDLYLKVTYGQPYKKERSIFGELVPLNEVWRTGANEATEITISKEVKIGDAGTLKEGTYTIFSIPREDKWSIIFNTELGQWGDTKYNETKSKNILTFDKAEVSRLEDKSYEAFTIMFEDASKGTVNMLLLWDNIKVTVPISLAK